MQQVSGRERDSRVAARGDSILITFIFLKRFGIFSSSNGSEPQRRA